MHPEHPTWKTRVVITRAPKTVDVNRSSTTYWRPAMLGDLSLRDWWEIVTHFMRNSDDREFAFVGRTGRYRVVLRDAQDTDEWVDIPPQPKVIIKKIPFARKKKKRHVPIFVHDPATYLNPDQSKDVHP